MTCGVSIPICSTGSAFGAVARFRLEQVVAIHGRSTVYGRRGDSGDLTEFHFCPECGSTVYWTSATNDDVAVSLGAFAGTELPPPRVSVYDERRHPWVTLPDTIERL